MSNALRCTEYAGPPVHQSLSTSSFNYSLHIISTLDVEQKHSISRVKHFLSLAFAHRAHQKDETQVPRKLVVTSGRREISNPSDDQTFIKNRLLPAQRELQPRPI